MTSISLWQTAIELTCFSTVNTIPLITKGSNPYKDMEVVKRMSHRRIVWFYYDIDDYSSDFWSVFLLHSLYSDTFDLNLSTAFDLSDRVGMAVDPRDIPPLWVLSVDYGNNIHK
jgi:hypothetical protein